MPDREFPETAPPHVPTPLATAPASGGGRRSSRCCATIACCIASTSCARCIKADSIRTSRSVAGSVGCIGSSPRSKVQCREANRSVDPSRRSPIVYHRTMPTRLRFFPAVSLPAAILLAAVRAASPPVVPAAEWRFAVRFLPAAHSRPYTGRVYIFFSRLRAEPRHDPSWFYPEEFIAQEVIALEIGGDTCLRQRRQENPLVSAAIGNPRSGWPPRASGCPLQSVREADRRRAGQWIQPGRHDWRRPARPGAAGVCRRSARAAADVPRSSLAEGAHRSIPAAVDFSWPRGVALGGSRSAGRLSVGSYPPLSNHFHGSRLRRHALSKPV